VSGVGVGVGVGVGAGVGVTTKRGTIGGIKRVPNGLRDSAPGAVFTRLRERLSE